MTAPSAKVAERRRSLAERLRKLAQSVEAAGDEVVTVTVTYSDTWETPVVRMSSSRTPKL